MHELAMSAVCLLVSTHIMAAPAAATASSTSKERVTVQADPSDPLEEILVEGERFEADLNPVEMGRIRDDSGEGARLYRQKRYREAYPLLLSAAENGFKYAQARVSYIYQRGLGGVTRDARAAIGWLGVAASPVTAPEIRDYYLRFMEAIPEELRSLADQIVVEYREKYDSNAMGLHCQHERQAGTHVARLKCEFEEEFATRDTLDEEAISTGIGDSAGGAGGSDL